MLPTILPSIRQLTAQRKQKNKKQKQNKTKTKQVGGKI